MNRRELLSTTLTLSTAVGLGVGITGCTAEGRSPSSPAGEPSPTQEPGAPKRVLVTFFSRAGENYYNGGRRVLQVGNTAVVVRLLTETLAVDSHKLVAAEPYPDSYDQTVARNVWEQTSNARPAIADPLPELAGYDTVILASPIWNGQPPMIMRTFTDDLQWSGKQVHPLVTYAVSGLGRAMDFYAQACPGAVIGEGLAVRGEEAAQSAGAVRSWLQRIGLVA